MVSDSDGVEEMGSLSHVLFTCLGRGTGKIEDHCSRASFPSRMVAMNPKSLGQ